MSWSWTIISSNVESRPDPDMCGVAAIINYNTPDPVSKPELLRIRDRMAPRGPDGAGVWVSNDGRVGLAHRRLSIIDLSEAGAQPMRSDDALAVIVFNGEIYNYRELAAELRRNGHSFRSGSDTEVLLKLWEVHGEAMVEHLRGMFGFAIWDRRRNGVFLARDPFGIKPLYVADNGKTVRVASQVKALVAGNGVDTSVEPAGHVGFFLWGHVPEPFTMFKGIRMVPNGTAVWIGLDGTRRDRVFCGIRDTLACPNSGRPEAGEDFSERLRSALLDSVRHHMVADVPVGVFLSAGLDSSTLTALASEAGGELRTLTLGFEEFKGTGNDEVPLAESVARAFGTRHETVWVKGADFFRDLEPLLDSMDQPSTDGVNTYFVSKVTAAAGLKVALSGLGGDEVFGGYPSFKEVPYTVSRLRHFGRVPAIGKAFRMVSAPVFKRMTSPKYAGVLEYGSSHGGAFLLRRGLFMPWELDGLLDRDLVRAGLETLEPVARMDEAVEGIANDRIRMSLLEMQFYMRDRLLKDTDWASMAHSLEIRVPMVDVRFARTLSPLLWRGDAPTKRSMAATPARSLPGEILNRPKSGFMVPVRDWLLGRESDRVERGLRGWARYVYQHHLAA